MPKKPSIKSAKAKAWRQFSRFIRLRDCLKTSGFLDEGDCITCGKRYPFEELQAGHFVDGRSKYVLFVEDAVHAQCASCNIFKKGNKDAYWPVMLERLGHGRCQEIVALKHKTGTWSVPELEEIEQKYKDKEAELATNQEDYR